jgi:hypothetical protein
MDEGEVMVLVISIVAGLFGVGVSATAALHPLYFRGNPAPGIVRLGVLGAMAWIAYVIWNHADPSVAGIYVAFYLVVGYAAVKLFGQSIAHAFGFRTRVDAGERRNVPAAMVIAAFIFATGLIFGGSLWGDADPVGDDEGGWWIPLTFFILGWATLIVAFVLYERSERGRLALRIRRERRIADARAAGAFLVSSAVALTDAVAGDFWGWRHGIFSFGLIAVLLIVHEAFAGWTRHEQVTSGAATGGGRRIFESVVYLWLAAIAWMASRAIDVALVGG